MDEFSTLLEETLEAWRYTRASLIDEAENIPAEDYGFRPTPENRTVGGLLRHVVEAGLMAAGELARPDGDFTRQPYPAFIDEYAGDLADRHDRSELIDLLRRTHARGEARIRDAGELRMLQTIRRFDGKPGTRLAWLHHHIAHEDYHRGQLALYARLLGHVPALTQKIQASG